MPFLEPLPETSSFPSLFCISASKLLLTSLSLSLSDLQYLQTFLRDRIQLDFHLEEWIYCFPKPSVIPSLRAISIARSLFATLKLSDKDVLYIQTSIHRQTCLRLNRARIDAYLPYVSSRKIKVVNQTSEESGAWWKDSYTFRDATTGRKVWFYVSFGCGRARNAEDEEMDEFEELMEENFQDEVELDSDSNPREIRTVLLHYRYQSFPGKGSEILIHDSSDRPVPRSFPARARKFFIRLAEVLELDLGEFKRSKKERKKELANEMAKGLVEMFVGRKGLEMFKKRMEAAQKRREEEAHQENQQEGT